MKKYLLVFSLIISFIFNEAIAQPATVGVPVSIGRDNCGTAGATVFANTNSGGGTVYSSCASNDSVYFFGYSNATLSKSTTLFSYLPRLRIGDSTYQGRFNIGGVTGVRNFRDRFTVSAASVSYNPRDRMIYYIWTDYNNQVKPGGGVRSYVWRWPPDTTFAPASIIPFNFPTATPPGIAAPSIALLDTIRSFTFDIGGVTFDNIGTTWQLEFGSTAPFKSRLRKMNFTTGFIDPIPDSLDLIPGAGGRGDTMYNVGSGDITLMPNGQMYYAFDNKLYTPDYGSYGGSTHHINSTYIDTIRRPTGATSLVGLAFSDGDLISSYSPGCIYRRIDPITGDTNFVNYTYPASKGVRSSDMTQITSGLGVAKRLVSATPTGVPKQYDVVYDVFVKNYGTTQITNIQVKDSLGGILGNGTPIGNGSVSNVSLSMQTIPPPPGIAINPAYNGTTNVNLLQSTSQNLNNFPADSTSFIIRINCRLSNIDTGIVYNNSAVGFANGYKNVPLRDSSTNGNVPDLNQNDKPDDVGESVPTPLLIALTGTRGGCATLTATLYSENFGSGTGLSSTLPGSYITTYTGSTTEPIARNTYTITNNARNADTTNFVSMTDHTGGANGRMMVFNADAPPRVFFRDTMPTSCPGRQYSLTFWTAFPANSVYAASCAALGGFRYPKVKMRMIDIVTGLDVVTLTTDSFYSPGWVQKGMRWTMPRGYSNLIMELSNSAPGGCGNDMVLDDIVYGTCDALPTVNASSLSGCLGDSIRFVGSLADSTVLPGPKDHQWQVAPTAGGPWADIAGATLPYLTINPILPADTGKFYRLIVAAQGSITIPICRSTSPGVKLTGTSPSTAPTNITAPSTTICSGSSVTLTAVGGTLGSGANYQWGTGSTVGTSPIAGATSSTLSVSPTSTTTYWVRIENTSSPCASATGGRTLTVTVNQPSVAPSSITGADICNPGSTTLTAVGGTLGTGANYQWGTGSTPGANPIAGATSSTYTVSPTVTTTYWVKIKNTTSPCADSTAGITKTITVNQPSVAPTSITAPSTTICNGGSVTLTAAGGTLGTGANYQWGTGSTVGTSPIGGATSSTLTVSPTSTTTYWVRIENTSSPCTAITGGTTVVVTVNQPSVAPTSITGANICNGSSTTLTALGGTLGTSANYQWGTGNTVGTSPIGGATSSTLTVSPSSTTTYWVRIENTSSPCTATTTGLTRVITVTQPSVAPTSITAPSTTLCGSGSVTLTATGGTLGTGANYQWGTGSTVGTSPIGGATSSTLTVSVSSTTTYWVRIENTSSPCTAVTGGTTVTITVNQSSVAPTSITGANICAGSSTTLTALGGTLGTSANYQWGTGSTVGTSPIVGATSSTLTVSPLSTTTYWVRIENTASPCTATTTGLTKVITVSQLSVPPTSAGKNKNGSICPGISVKIFRTGGSLGTGATWRWYTGSPGGTFIGTGDTLTVTPVVNTKYYIRAEGSCNTTTADSVSITISCDIDKDDDGIPDFVENRIVNATNVAQAFNTGVAGYKDNSNDFINDDYQADGDSDNDGIKNYLDTDFAGRVDSNSDGVDDRFDNDLDGIIDMLDLDSDNDGIPDVVEANGVDANGDGRIDNFTDTDGDGLSQNVDANNTGANNSSAGLGIVNFDNDNVTNEFDADSDNDGVPDVIEAGGPDTNNDGIIDGFVDANNDGLHDTYINATGLLRTGADVTSDGRADSYPNKNFDSDFRPNAYDVDSDGDGILDVTEAGFTNPSLIGWVVGPYGTDGWSDVVDAMASLTLRNTDGRGNPDYLDIDSDDDGIPDQIEGQPTANPLPAGYNMPLGTDADRDGLDTRYDNVPAAFGGAGILVMDLDGDGTPDYRDLDTDADGQPDIVEGNDFNMNGVADDDVALTFLDTDGDGLDNKFDSSNTVKGTSYNLSTGGYTAGDPAPGARCPVSRKNPAHTDRAWRYAGAVLPVQILSFTGTQQNNNVLLNWSIITPQEIDHFEIERSTNNSNYGKVGQLNSVVQLNIQQSFSYPDDITNINSDVIYYRLKVITKSGEIKYSNVLVVRKTTVKNTIAIMPNPAYDYLQIRLYSDKQADVSIKLIDASGKLILAKKEKVLKGNNNLQLNELSKFARGNYMLQINVGGEVTTHKVMLLQ